MTDQREPDEARPADQPEPPPGAVDPDHGDDTGEIPVVSADAVQRPAVDSDETPHGVDGAPTVASRSRRGRWIAAGAVAVVLGGLYVAGWYATGERMPAHVTVAGVEVGGRSPAAARTTLQRELGPREDDTLTLRHDDQEFEVDPQTAGLALDVDGSVAAAGGQRTWNPVQMVRLLVGSDEQGPVLTVDEDRLTSGLQPVVEGVRVPVTQPLIEFPDAKPKTRQPRNGLEARTDELEQAVRAAYLRTRAPIDVPTEVAEPDVDAEGLRAAVEDIAEPAISGPVRVRVGGRSIDLPVTAYAPALTVVAVDGTMEPRIDAGDLAEPLTDATTGIGSQAVDASIDIVDGRPVVRPGKRGVGLKPKEMATKLIPVLTRTGSERSVSVKAGVVEPDLTTQDARGLGVKEKVGEFTTSFPYAEYRNINQSRAAELIDGVLVEPGETFSFNDTVGERTRANGFTTGTIINGGVFREDLGGGVSQVVTTTYNAAFFAGMDDVEHHPHAFYIDRYPVGREATVAWGSLDLKFRNPTKHGVLIKASVQRATPGSQGATTVQLWSTKLWDVQAGASERRNLRKPGTRYDATDRCVAQAPVQGFDIDVYRTFQRGGSTVKRETVTARYQAADRVICGKRPADD